MILRKENKQPSSKKVVPLRVTKDNLLKKYIAICCLAKQKVYAFVRIRKYLTKEKTNILCSAFVNSQFNYTTVIRMLYRKIYTKRIKYIQSS